MLTFVLFLAGMAILPTSSFGKDMEDCEPGFYRSIPRDREWFYGVGKGPDFDAAREKAVRNLGVEVTGDVDFWAKANINQIAGPGQDRTTVAQGVGDLLPSSDLSPEIGDVRAFGGWEQDDRAICNGQRYALVRVEKARVVRFLRDNVKFRLILDTRLNALTKRVSQVEEQNQENGRRLDAIEQQLKEKDKTIANLVEELAKSRQTGAVPITALAHTSTDLRTRISDIRSDIAHKRPPAEVAKKIVVAEGIYNDLVTRMDSYGARREQVLTANVKKESHENKRREERMNQWATRTSKMMASSAMMFPLWKYYNGYLHYHRIPNARDREVAFYDDATTAINYFASQGRYQELANLCRNITSRFEVTAENHYDAMVREHAAAKLVQASSVLGDRESLLKDGEAFLRDYPTSKSFDMVKEYMAREIQTAQDVGQKPAPSLSNRNGLPEESLEHRLMMAVRNGQLDVVRDVLAKGANVNAFDITSTPPLTPLMIATLRDDVVMVEILIGNGADIDKEGVQGVTALVYARRRSKHKVAKVLWGYKHSLGRPVKPIKKTP